ncbi:AAA family ATPase [Agrococcus sp. SL85]|uniref:AAA family ATPase n=1 Tax=Agrococcus sp. SL85 TaxID=2995141 RepID=UPI00226D173F|nr:AAA family ATPase [Agrococcus sp. SL85]WAC67371.1 AAA family ATPase [Agrococcus sp. SL85]
MLIVMAGLPGSGKSTIAAALARRIGCAVVAADPIEAAMLRAGIAPDQPTGLAAYVAAEMVAREQLRLGHDVIVDAVNDAPEARQQWRDLAAAEGVDLRFVEVLAPDRGAHRERLEGRARDLPGIPEPTWASVQARREGCATWDEDRIRLVADRDPAHAAAAIERGLRARSRP